MSPQIAETPDLPTIGGGPLDDDSAETVQQLQARLTDLEWRYCLALDEIRQLSDVVRRDSDFAMTLQTRIELLERRLLQAAARDGDGDGDDGYRSDFGD